MRFIRSFLSVTALAVLAACGTPTPENLDPAGAARLETLKHAPDAAGTSIYPDHVPQILLDTARHFS
jgi:predicted small lipoprotein YifL